MKQECKHYYSRDQNSIAIINTEDSVSGGGGGGGLST